MLSGHQLITHAQLTAVPEFLIHNCRFRSAQHESVRDVQPVPAARVSGVRVLPVSVLPILQHRVIIARTLLHRFQSDHLWTCLALN